MLKALIYPLYLSMDYAIIRDSIANCGEPLPYCSYGKRNTLVEKLPDGNIKEFFRAWVWNSFRNNGMNLVCKLEDLVGPMLILRKYVKLWGKSKYEEREFKCGRLPYLELWFGEFRLQCGFISCGRFQVQFRTYP